MLKQVGLENKYGELQKKFIGCSAGLPKSLEGFFYRTVKYINTHTYVWVIGSDRTYGVYMSTKNISITEEAYRRLASLRQREKESFSEVIVREIGEKSSHRLLELRGILKGKKGIRFEENMKKLRKLREEMAHIQMKKIKEMFK